MEFNRENFSRFYRAPQEANWKGRSSDAEWPNQYLHEVIDIVHVDDLLSDREFSEGVKVAILGYACDEGVRRNLGRIGARNGPQSIRFQLAKLPVHFGKSLVLDLGDVICTDGEMEISQSILANIVELLLNRSIFPIVLGGGHDLSYGHMRGVIQGLNKETTRKIGMINFDAHFDLRKNEVQGNSGTPFFQLLTEHREDIKYCVVGIQKQSNSQELFATAEKLDVDYILHTDCTDSDFMSVQNRILSFLEENDYIYVSIDMDGFSSIFAQGVSAPSPFGLSPDFVLKLLVTIISSKKMIACDFAELNPTYDLDGRTASLAARLVNLVIERVVADDRTL